MHVEYPPLPLLQVIMRREKVAYGIVKGEEGNAEVGLERDS